MDVYLAPSKLEHPVYLVNYMRCPSDQFRSWYLLALAGEGKSRSEIRSSHARARGYRINARIADALYSELVHVRCLDLRSQTAHIWETQVIRDDDEEVWSLWNCHGGAGKDRHS